MSQYWFRAKTYGYGATPSNWRGWAATAAFVGMVVALTMSLLALPADMPAGPAAWQVGTWAVLVALLTLGFVRICRAKTDGQWSWRWGK
jgi:hypothetical protein